MRKKAKYVFMKKIKVKEYTKKVEKSFYKTDLSTDEYDENIGCSSEYYDEAQLNNLGQIDTTDAFEQLIDFDTEIYQPHKQLGNEYNMYPETGYNNFSQGYGDQGDYVGNDNIPITPYSNISPSQSSILFDDDMYSDSTTVTINPSNQIKAKKMFEDAMYVNNTPIEDEFQYSELDYIKNRNTDKQKPKATKKKQDTNNLGMGDDSLYDEKRKIRLKNTDNLDTLTVARNFRVTRKEALTSIEAKTPFIVGKMDDKHPSKSKAIIEEHDIVYRTIPKIKHSEFKASRRVGYLQVSDKPSYQPYNRKKTKHILGIINDEYIITKKKASNQRKIGYVRLEDDDSGIDKYVEVTKKKSTPFLLIIFLIIGILLFIKNFDSIEDWHVDFSKFRVYKTEEQLEYNQSVVTINHSAEATLQDNQIKINLKGNKGFDTSTPVMFKITLRDNNSSENPITLYESEFLEAGTLLQYIPINHPYEPGEYQIEIICDSYNADTNSFIGSIDSDFTLIVK